ETSSSEEDEPPAKKATLAKIAPKAVQKKVEPSSDDSSEDETPAKKATPAKIVPKAVQKKDESSSDDSSEAESPVKKVAQAKKSLNGVTKKVELSSSEGEEDKPLTKNAPSATVALKRKKTETSFDETEPAAKKADTRRKSEPFRRVTGSIYDIPENVRDNSYQNKADPWGAQAHDDLKRVQGKNFRHEKTKKKRGTYAGGKISLEVNSIKFADSD
uniref:Srp40 C-terminal domain-containing protein n=1 Tax=Panagrolaimus sp. ES5 TaxID=591445 RepID=A0AC34FMN1_9BILA